MATEVQVVLSDLLSGHLLDEPDVARALNASSRSVARWQARSAVPRRDAEERLLELKAVVDLLRRVLREEPARLWLRSPNPDLNYEKPLDLIAAGQFRIVIGAILAMAEGVTA